MTTITVQQAIALTTYAATHGRHWKEKLGNAWYNGSDERAPMGAYLRQVRNNLGPEWLQKLRLADLIKAPVVIYSKSESQGEHGEGFWSNEEGWTDFVKATEFRLDDTAWMNLPEASEGDSVWMFASDIPRRAYDGEVNYQTAVTGNSKRFERVEARSQLEAMDIMSRKVQAMKSVVKVVAGTIWESDPPASTSIKRPKVG